MPHRALLRTHHITSPYKIHLLTTAASSLSCSVLLKTGRPPGIMLLQSSSLENVEAWVKVVKRLRYKDFRVMRRGEVVGDFGVRAGQVRVFEEVGEVGRWLEEEGGREWWVEGMGWGKGEG